MDTGSVVQPGRHLTVFETAKELGGVLDVPALPIITAGYADIYQGTWTTPQGERIEVAVKELKPLIPKNRQTDPEQLKWKADTRLKREVFVWSQTTHPNLHRLLGYRLQPRPRLISPWCHHGNLNDYLQANLGLSRCDKLRLIFQTACGLEHLHAQAPPICHADVKPENVLINEFQGPALSDFGLSRVLQDLDEPSGFTTSETVKGTLKYKAPELFMGQKPNLESDVYAFGGLILTAMSGRAPFSGLADEVIMRRVMQDQPPRPMHHPNLPAGDPLWALMRRCWHKRPTARPTMREVLLELLGHIMSEQDNPSSEPGHPSVSEHSTGAFSNTDLDVTGGLQSAPILSLTFNGSVVGHTTGVFYAGQTENPIPRNVLVVSRERLRRLGVRSKIIPTMGKYIGAVVNAGLSLVEILERMERSKNMVKSLESGMWKLVNLVQSVEDRFSEHEDDDIPHLVGEIQRELQCVRTKIEGLRFPEFFGDSFVLCDEEHMTECHGRIQKMAEEVELLVNLNISCLLTELENTEWQDQARRLLNCLGDGSYGAEGNAVEDVSCLPGTRVQILDRIDNWIRDTSTSNRVLWIRGMAGRGKSTIASTVAHNWRYRASCAIFHFRRGQNTRNRRIICALARQLGSSLDPDVRNAVLKSVRENEDIADQRLSVQFETLFIAPLSLPQHHPHIILIVVDALDECDNPKDAEDLVKLIDRHFSSLPINVKFLLTCRPEAALVRTLGRREWHVVDLDSSLDVVHDLARFFKQALGEIREDHDLSQDWPSQNDVSRLVEMSQGLFQWARTATTYIGIRSPDHRLRELLKRASIWSGLDDLYHQILSKAFDNTRLDPSRRELLSQILGILVVAPHPVSIEVVATLLWNINSSISESASKDDFAQFLCQDVLADLRSLLLIPPQSSEPLCLMHNSIRDLLISQQRCRDRAYYTDVVWHHEHLAGMCLDLMVRCLKENICNLSDISKPNSEIQDTVDREVSTSLRYCCRAWSIHLTEGAQWSELRSDGARRLRLDFEIFSKEKVLCWLEVMSMVGATTEAMATARRVHQWLLQCPAELSVSNSINSLWSDIQRFIAAFLEPISFGPLHIYISALCHCPQKTVLWKWYGKYAKIRMVHGVQPETWPCNLWTTSAGTPILTIEFSPDGATLACGYDDGKIQLLDPQTGATLGGPLTGLGHVSSIAFSPDGKVLASGSWGGKIQLWDAQTGTPLGKALIANDRWVTVAFSPDGKVLLASSGDGKTRLWDGQTGAPLGEQLTVYHGRAMSAAFSLDSRTLAFGSLDGHVQLFDAQTGTPLGGPLTGHNGWVGCVAFSPDGKVLASGSEDGTIRLWDPQTGLPLGKPLKCDGSGVCSVAFSPDSKVLASGCFYNRIQLWDAQTGSPLGEPLRGHDGGVCCVAFSPDGKTLVSGSFDSTIRAWNAQTGTRLGEQARVLDCSLAFSPDGKVMASGSFDGTIRLWDAQTGTLLREPLTGHRSEVCSIVFSSDGKVLLSLSTECAIRLWDAQTGTPLCEPFTDHDQWINTFALSPAGEILATGYEDGSIRLWDTQVGTPLGEPLRGHHDELSCVEFSPDGKALVSGSYDRTIQLWDTQTGKPLCEPLNAHHLAVSDIVFSPDSKVLVFGFRDGTIQSWDTQTGTPLGEILTDRDRCITSVAFSPLGKVLVTGSDDGSIRLWDTQAGTPLSEPLPGHARKISYVGFSPDGKVLVSGSSDGTTRLWDPQTATPLGVLFIGRCRRVASLTFSSDRKVLQFELDDGTTQVWDINDCSRLVRQERVNTSIAPAVQVPRAEPGMYLAPDNTSTSLLNH